jgi:hypothetical protein
VWYLLQELPKSDLPTPICPEIAHLACDLLAVKLKLAYVEPSMASCRYFGFSGDILDVSCESNFNSLTLIPDVNGDIFAGFTLLKWESRDSVDCEKSAQSLRVETWMNPEKKDLRIFCHRKPDPVQLIVSFRCG